MAEAGPLRLPMDSLRCRAHHQAPGHWLVESAATKTPLEVRLDAEDVAVPIFDPITCRPDTAMFVKQGNHRDGGWAAVSRSSNRMRSLAVAILHAAVTMSRTQLLRPIQCLPDLKHLGRPPLRIYNAESSGPLHDALHALGKKGTIRYTSSEYVPGDHSSGTWVRRRGQRLDRASVLHQDLQNTSFESRTFDVVVSTEVFEHIPHPYAAHKELLRILRPGGAHVFTVPFVSNSDGDLVMSRMLQNGSVVHGPGAHGWQPPLYHLDPLRPGGVLVYTLFGQQMLTRLCHIGFDVEARRMQNEGLGIIGGNVILFTAWAARDVAVS